MKKFIHWCPRVLAVLFVALTIPFIGEGLDPEFSWFDSLMHLLLTLVIAGFTFVAWKWPKYGGWIFIVLGIAIGLLNFSRGNIGPAFFVGGIPVITGILFLVDGFRKKDIISKK